MHDAVLAACRKHRAEDRAGGYFLRAAARLCRVWRDRGSAGARAGGGRIAAGGSDCYLPVQFVGILHGLPCGNFGWRDSDLLNPSYREREVRHQLGNSGAAFLITDGPTIAGINLAGLPNLRRVFYTREQGSAAEPFSDLLKPVSAVLPEPGEGSEKTLGALPYSSGTTGLPKGVMLSHYNLISNVYQFLGPHGTPLNSDDNILCFLPLYHIYGLNVMLNPSLILGATLVLMPRFGVPQVTQLITEEAITMMPLVPPAMNALCLAAEAGQFPKNHKLHLGEVWSGAAGSGTAAKIHGAHGHSGVSGIRHDGGVAGDALEFSGARTLPAGFDRASAGADGVPSDWDGESRLLRRRAPRKFLRASRASW